MFGTRRIMLRDSLLAASCIVAAGALATSCTGDKGDTGDTGPAGPAGSGGTPAGTTDPAAAFATKTPIKHVVIIFGENVSFDHYFGTYPKAAFTVPGNAGAPVAMPPTPNPNPDNEIPFVPLTGTPLANNLLTPLDVNNNFASINSPPTATTTLDLINNNPNSLNPDNGADQASAKPFRLDPKEASTQDQSHNYGPEQLASHGGAMDLFPAFTGVINPPLFTPADKGKSLVMGYYDGNTVTAYWNYAQHYAMSDNSWTTQFGPSTPGAINLISGQTNGLIMLNNDPSTFGKTHIMTDGQGGFTMIGDTDPLNDVCSIAHDQHLMAGKNVGDLLNDKGITWGSFMGGFNLDIVNANGTTGCGRLTNPTPQPFTGASPDYIPHHAWFQYYASTANPLHLRPSSIAAIGSSKTADGKPEPANHNYDSVDFFDTLAAGNLPAVNFVKAPAYQDGHGGYSNPLDEQAFVVSVVNALQNSSFWDSTAVIVAYDDSDGWYDHQAPPIVNPSSDAAIGNTGTPVDIVDQLNGPGVCNSTTFQQGLAVRTTALPGAGSTKPVLGRCGYGTRIPLMVISPFAKKNFIDHTLTDQTSVLRFIEDNWLSGQRIQDGASFDTIAGPIDNMFDFTAKAAAAERTLPLDEKTGTVLAHAELAR